MIRTLPVIVATLALLGCGGTEEAATPPATTTAAAAPAEAVLAVWNDDVRGSEIFWADGRTLEPVDGRSVSFSYYYSAIDRSPDGATLALGADDRGYVQLIDLDRMESLGTVDVGGSGYFERLHWVAPDLLLASISGLPSRAVALDPGTQTILSENELQGTVLSSRPVEGGLVLLLAPSDRIGPARLAVFDGESVRTAELREIPAGWEQESDGETEQDYRARQSIPGLAVDPAGGRALVVPAGNRVAEIDLETLEVGYHELSEPVSLLGRLRDWLEPAAHAKSVDGPERNAVWLPSGLVAVSGSHYAADGDRMDVTPAGLTLIDPSDWSVRRLSDETNWVSTRSDALLASSWKENSNAQTVVVFDTDGEERFSLTRPAADLSQASGGLLYAATDEGRRYEIVDLETGETVGRATPKRGTWLVYLDE
jgi:DNA-binding beta-propeller fold protein YncE